MKKILLYGLSTLGLLFGVSCSDLLEEESYTEVGKGNYVNNAAEAETVLMGIYKDLSNEYLYSYHLSLLFTISSDIAQCEGNSDDVVPRDSDQFAQPVDAADHADVAETLFVDLRRQRLHRDGIVAPGRLELFESGVGDDLPG